MALGENDGGGWYLFLNLQGVSTNPVPRLDFPQKPDVYFFPHKIIIIQQ